MGREREKKGAVVVLQQQWQAKGGYSTAGAYSAVLGKLNKQEECYLSIGAAEGSSSSSSSAGASAMKDPLARTKVVVRRLPPTLSEQAFVAQIEAKFAKSYSWLTFRPGKSTHRTQVNSRAYIEFKRPEDVLTFHEDFDGHVFVNEKGSQYKASVEYAPYQRVPDFRLKKDGREGSILKDPDYLEFLETLSKPNEVLPSAEVQLERRDLTMGSCKDVPIVTPLMEFVRQKRAAKLAQRASKSGFRSIMGPAPGGFVIQKRGEKGKSGSSGENSKEASMYVRREQKKRREAEFKEKKSIRDSISSVDDNGLHKESDEASADAQEVKAQESDGQRRKLLKEKDKNEAGYVSRGRPPVSPAQGFKHSNYRERSARAGSPKGTESGRVLKSQAMRASETDSFGNGTVASGTDGRRLRNKDRPDRPVWTPRRRLDAMDPEADSEGIQGAKGLPARTRTRAQDANEPENDLDGRNGPFENGTYRSGIKKGPKDVDSVTEAGKHLKRGASPFGNNEKQVWVAVQKTG